MNKYLGGKDVVLLSSTNYETHAKTMLNAQILAKELAEKGVNVLFVESLGLKTLPLMGKGDIQKVFKRSVDSIKTLFHGVANPEKGVYILSIARLPFEKIPFVKWINKKIISYTVQKYSEEHLRKDPILLLFLPTTHYLIDTLNPSLSVYYCVDDYSEVPFVDSSYILKEEQKTAKKVDLVITVSRNRMKYFKEIGIQAVHYLNNVARFRLFNKALKESFNPPANMKKILAQKKPIVGFVGNLASYKEDLELLTELVSSSPEYSFMFIGPIGSGEMVTDLEKLKKQKNAYFLGPIDYEELYKYLKYTDVAIIARRINKANEGGFPLKYFEYLSAGLPVVVTDISSLHEFSKISDLGGIAKNSAEFKERIRYWVELKRSSPVEYKKALKFRLEIAKQNSWENRMKELGQILKI